MAQTGIQLIASDLDGTLLNSHHEVSPRTVAALQAWQEAGRHVVIATGRPPRWVTFLLEFGFSEGLVICSNGALTYDLATAQTSIRRCLDLESVQLLIKAMREVAPAATFAVEFGDRVIRDQNFPVTDPTAAETSHDDVSRLTQSDPIAKLLMHSANHELEDLLRIATETIDPMLALATISGDRYLEVAAAGITKADALIEHAQRLGLDASQVIAFGDQQNDIPMLEWAGHSVAMDNGAGIVKGLATEVTATNDEDGVAVVIERLLRN